jgi:monoamine oxidase
MDLQSLGKRRRCRRTSTWNRRMFLKLAGCSALSLPWSACSRTGPRTLSGSVIVGGAGLSGLAAAMLLEERGIRVTVLEARDRLGGKIVTMNGVPGLPEGGGPTIIEAYERLLRIAAAVGVRMVPGPAFEPDMLLHVSGQSVKVQEWANSPANRTEGAERPIPPPLLLSYYTAQKLPLEDFSAWIAPRHAALDIPLDEYLRGLGASREALRLINVAPNTNDIATTSALWALRDAQRRRDTKAKTVLGAEGGNSRFIERMAASLKSEILKGKEIRAVTSLSDRVEVACADGSKFQADYCILTMPFSVLRDVVIDPPLEGPQKEAVAQLPHTAITKYFVVPKAPFWDEDGLPPTMWTDSIIERVFPMRDDKGRIENFTVWVDGNSARKLDAMPRADQERLVLEELARMRPATRGRVEIAAMISWGNDPYARGAYEHYGVGHVTRFKPYMARPWKRIHFAGEHTAVTSPGMEGAIESAERAVDELLQRYA